VAFSWPAARPCPRRSRRRSLSPSLRRAPHSASRSADLESTTRMSELAARGIRAERVRVVTQLGLSLKLAVEGVVGRDRAQQMLDLAAGGDPEPLVRAVEDDWQPTDKAKLPCVELDQLPVLLDDKVAKLELVVIHNAGNDDHVAIANCLASLAERLVVAPAGLATQVQVLRRDLTVDGVTDRDARTVSSLLPELGGRRVGAGVRPVRRHQRQGRVQHGEVAARPARSARPMPHRVPRRRRPDPAEPAAARRAAAVPAAGRLGRTDGRPGGRPARPGRRRPAERSPGSARPGPPHRSGLPARPRRAAGPPVGTAASSGRTVRRA
jgi:hypothetical protein